MINIMIADDHKLVREGLKKLLEFEGDIKVIEEADNGKDCLAKVKTAKPQVLLLDFNMPIMSGLEVIPKLRRKRSKMKVLVLTVHNEIEYLLKAVDLGVDGYILKDADSQDLRKAILTLMEGKKYIQPTLIPLLNSKLIARDMDHEKIERLSDREITVLQLVASGTPNKDIGARLEISERTVKNHLTSIFKKIEVADRTQATLFAVRNNLVNVR